MFRKRKAASPTKSVGQARKSKQPRSAPSKSTATGQKKSKPDPNEEFWIPYGRGQRCGAPFPGDGELYPAVARRTKQEKASDIPEGTPRVLVAKWAQQPWAVEFDNPVIHERRTDFLSLGAIHFHSKAALVKQHQLPTTAKDRSTEHFCVNTLVLVRLKGMRDSVAGLIRQAPARTSRKMIADSAKVAVTLLQRDKNDGSLMHETVKAKDLILMDRNSSWRYHDGKNIWPTTRDNHKALPVSWKDFSRDPKCRLCGRFLLHDEHQYGLCGECLYQCMVCRHEWEMPKPRTEPGKARCRKCGDREVLSELGSDLCRECLCVTMAGPR